MSKLTHYKKSIDELVNIAGGLQIIAHEIENYDLFEQLKIVKIWAEEQDLLLATVGEVSVGKSSFLNALLGQPVLPVSAKESTALVTHVRRGENLKVSLYIKGQQVLSSNDLTSFNDSYTVHSKKWKEEQTGRLALFKKVMTTKNEVDEDTYIDIQLNHPLLHNRLRIIDTPGLNDSGGIRSVITKRFVRKADAAIVLMRADKLLSSSELLFFEEYILKKHTDHIFILVNRFDRLDEQDQSKVRAAAYERFGALSIPEQNIFFISAKQALQANQLEEFVAKGEGELPIKSLQRQADHLSQEEKVTLAEQEMVRLKKSSSLNHFFNSLQEFLVAEKGEGRIKKIETQLKETGERLIAELNLANKDLRRTSEEVQVELEINRVKRETSEKAMEETRKKFSEKTRMEKREFIERFESMFQSLKKEVEEETKRTVISSAQEANSVLEARADELVERVQYWIKEELPRVEHNVRQIYMNEYSNQVPAVQNLFVMPVVQSEFLPVESNTTSNNSDSAAVTGAAVGLGAAALLGVGLLGALLLVPAAAIGASIIAEESSSSSRNKMNERLNKEVDKLYVKLEKNSKKAIQDGFDSSVEMWMSEMEESVQAAYNRTEKRLRKVEESFKNEESIVASEIEHINTLINKVQTQLARL